MFVFFHTFFRRRRVMTEFDWCDFLRIHSTTYHCHICNIIDLTTFYPPYLTARLNETPGKINHKVDLDSPKVATQEKLGAGDKKVYCRCWQSGTFPLCDGAHMKHNEAWVMSFVIRYYIICGLHFTFNLCPMIYTVEPETTLVPWLSVLPRPSKFWIWLSKKGKQCWWHNSRQN